jgi:uracil-DNA glycosylase family 4
MTEVSSVAEINKEIVKRAQQMGLTVDCGADGIFNSEIAIIAEAPGDRERTMKMPLVGGSGQELWNTLRQFGITRRGVYISNVLEATTPWRWQMLTERKDRSWRNVHVY